MERRDSMDGAMRLNGWTETVQWMDKRLPIWHGIASFYFTADSHPIHNPQKSRKTPLPADAEPFDGKRLDAELVHALPDQL